MVDARKVAMVTGAAGGIGRATSLKLGGLGYAVVLVGRTAETLKNVADELQSDGREVLALVADVSQSGEVDRMVGQVVEKWGRIDVVVNNAGKVLSRPIAQTSDEEWHGIIDANLSSAFYMTRTVWPVMKAQFEAQPGADPADGGVIVNISSRAAHDPFPGLGAYAIAKSGMNMLTLVSAREGVKAGIRVVGIAPGAVDTEMFARLVGKQNVNLAAVLKPGDVAAMIADVVVGSLRNSSGETLYLHRRPN